MKRAVKDVCVLLGIGLLALFVLGRMVHGALGLSRSQSPAVAAVVVILVTLATLIGLWQKYKGRVKSDKSQE